MAQTTFKRKSSSKTMQVQQVKYVVWFKC